MHPHRSVTSANRRTAPLALLSLATLLPAQSTIVVPDRFPEIGPAVQASAPGGVIMVRWRASGYQPFVVDRTITIVGEGGEARTPTVFVQSGIGIDVRLGAGQAATISRIDVIAAQGPSIARALVVNGGRLGLEDCQLFGGSDPSGAAFVATLTATDSELLLTRCHAQGGLGVFGMLAARCRLESFECRFGGGSVPAADGAWLHDCEVHGCGVEVLGGLAAQGRGGHGLIASGTTRAWLVDTVGTGGIGRPGGHALLNATATPFEMLRQLVNGGVDLGTQQRVAAVVGPTTTNPALLAMTMAEPPYRHGALKLGNPFGVHVLTTPALPAAILVSAVLPGTAATPLARQPLLRASDVLFVVAGTTQPSGHLSLQATVPANPALIGLQLWFQGAAGTALPLEASPVLGAVVRP